ncbi:MAG: hypothetical protein ACI8S6_004985 [Myxococcota bacterium]|jgi:hypothetical protein
MRLRAPLTVLLLSSTAAIAAYAPGTMIVDAIMVDITPEGFDAVVDVIPALLPDQIDIPSQADDGGIYEYALDNMSVSIGLTDAQIVPQYDYLDLDIDLEIAVSSSSSPFSIYYEILWVISETCSGYVNPFDANISAQIGLSVVDTDGDGIGELDATISNVSFDYDIDGANDISISGCSVGYIEEALNFFGLSLFDLILDLAGPLLDSAIAGFIPDLEQTIEDAFADAYFSDTTDLNGVLLSYEIAPSDVIITPDGLRLALSGGLSTAEPAACIEAYDPGGSLETPSDQPFIGEGPGHHAGIFLSDDFGNQALYSLWRGGLLCYTLTAEEIGFPIDTSILGLLAGDAFKDLFPSSKPLIIETSPVIPPTLAFDGSHDIDLELAELGLDFYGELDYRQALILGMDLDGAVGVDLDLDGVTGELGILLDLSGESLAATAARNEFVPEASAAIEDNFAGVFDSLVGGIVGGLLEDLSFPLPAIEGLGLTSLLLEPAGPDGDYLGAYASLGAVSYTSGGCGCGEDPKKGDAGCDTGCATGGAPSKLGFLGMILSFAFLRRRQDD